MTEQVHTEDLNKSNEDIPMDEAVGKDVIKPDSLELQELLKQRIERVKKVFRPAGMMQHIKSLDNKGK